MTRAKPKSERAPAKPKTPTGVWVVSATMPDHIGAYHPIRTLSGVRVVEMSRRKDHYLAWPGMDVAMTYYPHSDGEYIKKGWIIHTLCYAETSDSIARKDDALRELAAWVARRDAIDPIERMARNEAEVAAYLARTRRTR